MDKLQRFLNSDGQVTQWPAKRSMQPLILEYLATKFDPSKTYTERQINEILNDWHTFGDWAMLRRALVDNQLLAARPKRCGIPSNRYEPTK